MRRKLRIGIAYDVKEDYSISAEGFKHCDFSTLAEISALKASLERRGHTVTLLGNYRKIYHMLMSKTFPDVDIVFNTAEGIISRNREGWLPSLYEINGIPYSGSDAYTLGLTLNKAHTKIMAQYLGIPTPPFCTICSADEIDQLPGRLQAPWIVKPNYEGSSSGVRYAEDIGQLRVMAAELLQEYQQPILCEQYIPGREFTVSVLYSGEKAKCIGTVEIVRKDQKEIKIFSAEDKYSDTCTKIPAVLPTAILKKMEADTLRLYRFFECNDYGRADFRVDPMGNYYLLELTPLPNIDDESGFGKCCTLNGLNLERAYEEILYSALCRYPTGTARRL